MISVIIPTHNREEKLIRSLNSVLNQSYQDLEVIVVDDGSTDNTENAIKGIKDKRVKYFKHKTNLGGGAARNTGIAKAHGDFIAFQDSDDVWYENKLDVELNCLLLHDADIVFCKMNKIVNGKIINSIPDYYDEGVLQPGTNVYGIGTPTLLCKAKVFETERFDEQLPRLQDMELMLRLADRFTIYCCDQVLMDTYFDERSTATSGNPQKLLKAAFVIHEKYPKLSKQYPGVSTHIARNLIVQSYRDDVDEKDKYEMRNMAIRIDLTGKTFLKYVAAKIGLFPYINKQAAALRKK